MASEATGSVTDHLGHLKAGAPDAVQPLWERYYGTLVRLPRAKLRQTLRGAADEEDVALSAFDSFCAGVKRGQFSKLEDRDDLWKILVTITCRKAYDLIQSERRRKPKAGRLITGSELGPDVDVFSLITGAGPSPEFAASVAEHCGRLLDALGDDLLRRIALQPDGKIVMAASQYLSRRTIEQRVPLSDREDMVVRPSHQPDPTYDVAVLRYKPDGTLDDRFGARGVVFTEFEAEKYASNNFLALQADGKIVVAGTSSQPAGFDFALLRYVGRDQWVWKARSW
jgi:hypothetical protein